MFMRTCPNNTQTTKLKHVKNHENFIENLSQMSPNSLENLLYSILGSFSAPFRAQVGSRTLPLVRGTRLLEPFWPKMALQGAVFEHPWIQNGSKIALLSLDRRFDLPKITIALFSQPLHTLRN